jgi:hypothetical protein
MQFPLICLPACLRMAACCCRQLLPDAAAWQAADRARRTPTQPAASCPALHRCASLQGLPEDCQAALVGLLPPALGDWNVTEGLDMLDQYCGTAFANATSTSARLVVDEGEAGERAAVRWLPACRNALCCVPLGGVRWNAAVLAAQKDKMLASLA